MMKLSISFKDKESQFFGVPTSILAAVFTLSVTTPMQAHAVSSAGQEKQIEALEKRVRMLEKLLNQQVQANKVASHQAATSRQVKPAPRQVIVEAPPKPAFSQDKKIHLGGITITP